MDAKLPQLPDNARRTPRGVGLPHILDQLPDFFGEGWPAGFAALTEPSPVISASFLLPGDDGPGLHELQRLLPAGPQAGEPDPEHTVSRLKLRSGDTLLLDCDLMVQGNAFHLHGHP